MCAIWDILIFHILDINSEILVLYHLMFTLFDEQCYHSGSSFWKGHCSPDRWRNYHCPWTQKEHRQWWNWLKVNPPPIPVLHLFPVGSHIDTGSCQLMSLSVLVFQSKSATFRFWSQLFLFIVLLKLDVTVDILEMYLSTIITLFLTPDYIFCQCPWIKDG
jgi:hypothetical protein